jgi:hypothetical protein
MKKGMIYGHDLYNNFGVVTMTTLDIKHCNIIQIYFLKLF